jgi:hypothetical protein
MPLYASEETIAALVLGKGRLKEWRSLAIVLERHGLPQIDPMTGCRYVPAVRAFFDHRHGVAGAAPFSAPDGVESLDWLSNPRRRTPRSPRD